MSEPIELAPMPTIAPELPASIVMKLTMSISDGTHVWMAITPEGWQQLKAQGDSVIADTVRLSN